MRAATRLTARKKRNTRRKAPNLVAVLLAAGGSSRLGRPKQLVRFRGRALVLRAADAAAAAIGDGAGGGGGGDVIVVVGAEALRLRALLARSYGSRVDVVHHAAWREGLSSSLRRGLAAVPREARGVMFLLADQPLVGASSLERLIAAWRRRPSHAAAAVYSGRIGVPAILPRRAFRALKELSGDEGARRVLAAASGVTRVDMPEAAIDVDTLDDLKTLARLPAAPRGARARRSRS